VRDLHLRTARWFLTEGDLLSAVQHFVTADALDELVELLNVEIPRALDREDWASVAEWLDRIPAATIASSPVLALGRWWVLFFKGSWVGMRSARADLEKLLETLPASDPAREHWLAELAVLVAHEAPPRPDDAARALDMIEAAAPHLDPERRFVRGHAEYRRITALADLGRIAEADAAITAAVGRVGAQVDSAMVRPLVGRCIILRQRGAFPQLETAAAELAALADARELPVARGWGNVFHALVLVQRNDLAAAEPILAALATDHRRINVVCLREGMFLLARCYWAMGDATEATAIVRRLRELLVNRGAVEMLPGIASFERFLAFLEDPDHARDNHWTWDAETILATTPHFAHHPVTTALLLSSEDGRDRAGDALQLVDAFARLTADVHFTAWQPETLVLRAVALSALDRDREAIHAAHAALMSAPAKFMIRSLMDLGPRAHALYRRLADDPDVGALARLLTGDARAAQTHVPVTNPPQTTSNATTPILSLLTDRELAVLDLLEQRLSYKEIGSALFISPLTVKRHAGNIYDKLGVDCRRDAVAVANELGWRGPRTIR
jgi:ATP/maltotriose-dependent transcriptional regulator MalT